MQKRGRKKAASKIMPQPLWGPKETAVLLGLTEKAVRTRAYRMQLPHVKVGKRLKFRPESIARYVRDNEVQVETK